MKQSFYPLETRELQGRAGDGRVGGSVIIAEGWSTGAQLQETTKLESYRDDTAFALKYFEKHLL